MRSMTTKFTREQRKCKQSTKAFSEDTKSISVLRQWQCFIQITTKKFSKQKQTWILYLGRGGSSLLSSSKRKWVQCGLRKVFIAAIGGEIGWQGNEVLIHKRKSFGASAKWSHLMQAWLDTFLIIFENYFNFQPCFFSQWCTNYIK